MKVVPVPVRSDNYAYLLVDDSSSDSKPTVAVVDPYDVSKVEEALKSEGIDDISNSVVAIITTHHHDDHAGGNLEFVSWLLSLSQCTIDMCKQAGMIGLLFFSRGQNG